MTNFFRIAAFVAVLVGLIGFMIYSYVHDVAPGPCKPGEFPISCYNVTPKMCEFIWSKSEKECKDFVAKFKLPPGRLTGPIILECQFATIDSAFAVNRKSTPECVDRINEIEGWKRRNDFK